MTKKKKKKKMKKKSSMTLDFVFQFPAGGCCCRTAVNKDLGMKT